MTNFGCDGDDEPDLSPSDSDAVDDPELWIEAARLNLHSSDSVVPKCVRDRAWKLLYTLEIDDQHAPASITQTCESVVIGWVYMGLWLHVIVTSSDTWVWWLGGSMLAPGRCLSSMDGGVRTNYLRWKLKRLYQETGAEEPL